MLSPMLTIQLAEVEEVEAKAREEEKARCQMRVAGQ